MLFYFNLMIFIALLGILDEKKINKIIITLVVSSMLIIIAGCRASYIGNDTLNYVDFFYLMKGYDGWILDAHRFEKGFQIFTAFAGRLSDNPQILIFLSSLIGIGGISYVIYKYSRNVAFSFFLFVGLRVYFEHFNIMRQALAESLIFLSFIFLCKKNIKLYVLLVAIATTFHTSAIIFLLAWPISRLKYNKRNFMLAGIAVLVIYLFFDQIIMSMLYILPEYYANYLGSDQFASDRLATYIDSLIKLICLIMAYILDYSGIRKVEKCENNSVDRIIFYFMYISLALSIISTKAALLDRLIPYFWDFSIIGITNMIWNIKDIRKRVIVILITSFCVISYCITILWLRPDWNRVYPYEFFF